MYMYAYFVDDFLIVQRFRHLQNAIFCMIHFFCPWTREIVLNKQSEMNGMIKFTGMISRKC